MAKDSKGYGSEAKRLAMYKAAMNQVGGEMPSGKKIPSSHSTYQGKAKITIRDTTQISPEAAAAARARRGGTFGT